MVTTDLKDRAMQLCERRHLMAGPAPGVPCGDCAGIVSWLEEEMKPRIATGVGLTDEAGEEEFVDKLVLVDGTVIDFNDATKPWEGINTSPEGKVTVTWRNGPEETFFPSAILKRVQTPWPEPEIPPVYVNPALEMTGVRGSGQPYGEGSGLITFLVGAMLGGVIGAVGISLVRLWFWS